MHAKSQQTTGNSQGTQQSIYTRKKKIYGHDHVFTYRTRRGVTFIYSYAVPGMHAYVAHKKHTHKDRWVRVSASSPRVRPT